MDIDVAACQGIADHIGALVWPNRPPAYGDVEGFGGTGIGGIIPDGHIDHVERLVADGEFGMGDTWRKRQTKRNGQDPPGAGNAD